MTSSENRCGPSRGHHAEHKKCERRPSSFWMHDAELIFRELNLKTGEVFLDLGCGAGDYTLQAARRVGPGGVVYALDLWQETVESLQAEAGAQGLQQIKAMVGDITGPLPIGDNSVDLCLIATVLHAIDMANHWPMFQEIHRVLKPGGRLAIIECKKEEMAFGPPKHMRLAPEELEKPITQYGFSKTGFVELDYNYMLQFALNR